MSKRVVLDHEAAIREIRDLYNEAEADLKTVGSIRNELCIASVNQLRYAGQHLVRALAADDDDTVVSDLDAAKRHAQRAVYDVNDAAIQHYLYEIDHFRKQYPVNLNAVVPSYADITKAVDEASEHIAQVNQKNRSNRGLSYAEARTAVAALRQAYRQLNASHPAVVEEMKRHNRTTRTTWLSISLTVFMIVIAIIRLLDN